MPNAGPSRACQVCKSRKVKCDETEPSCQRCLRSGVQCPGYPQEWDVMFRDMTGIAERQVRSRAGAEASRGSQPRISPPVSTDWKSIAIPRFFANYVHSSKIIVEGDMSFLPQLCEQRNSCEALKAALDAVSWLNLSNQAGMESLELEAQKAYVKAIGLVAGLLQDEEEARKDTTLAANYLFGLFEQISGFKFSSSNWSHNRHLPGRTSLLRLRGADQFKTPLGRNMFRMSYASLTTKCLHDHTKPAEEAETWLASFPPTAYDPQLNLARCNLRLIRLCVDAQDLVKRKNEEMEWMLALLRVIKEAILLDEDYQLWEESHFESWRPRNIRKNPTLSQRAAAATSHGVAAQDPRGVTQQVYEDVNVAYNWNNYRSARIHLNEVLIRCCSMATAHTYAPALELDFEDTETQSRSTISELVSDICASVPFCLGEIDSSGNPAAGISLAIGGYLMLWPIYVAMSSTRDDAEKQLWFRGKLDYISGKMGIRMAQMILEKPIMDPWDLRCLKPEVAVT